MKMRKTLFTLIIALLSISLFAGCGGTAKDENKGKTENTQPVEKSEEVKQETEPKEEKKEETINQYTAENGMYAISLPGEWDEEDNMGMSSILTLSGSNGADIVVMGLTKSQIIGAGVESLQDFYDYAEASMLNGAASSTTLSDTDAIPLSGFTGTLAKEGKMTQSNGASGSLFVQCVESENAYYLIMLSGISNFDEMVASMRDNLSFEELAVPEIEELSDTLRWFNGTYAVITKLNGGDLNLVAGYEPSDMSQKLEQSLLERDWGVTDRASLDETLDWLLTEGHNEEALYMFTDIGVEGMSREEIATAMNESGFDEEEQIMILAIYDAKAAYGENAIAGWDLSRAMSLMGWGYLAGYYTYEEAMDKSLETAQMIQQTFGSWDDFFNSYFLGYSYWSEQDLEDPTSKAYERRAVYEELKADPVGVYSVDWNTALTKEW